MTISSTSGQDATARELAAQIRAGTTTSEALVIAALARAKQTEASNAFVTLDEKGALEAARHVDAQQKTPLSPPHALPLLGVPIVIKDNIAVAGLPLTGGTPALAKFIPTEDAPVVKRLRDAGAIIIGKTHMHELAFGISGYNPTFNTGPDVGTRNAYDHARVAGGSSSGTASALGARVVTIGLGTDTGGSVRVPCAFNGCAALRPTVGRYSQDGVLPLSHTRDTIGPMTVSMVDIELLDRVITGDATIGAASLSDVRLGLAKEFLTNMDADTQAAFDDAVKKLQAAGVTFVDVEMPNLETLNTAVGFPLALYEAYDDIVAFLKKHDTGVTIEDMAQQIASPDVKGTFDGLVIPRQLPGPDNTTVDAKPIYEEAIKTGRPLLQKLYADVFAVNGLDALAFPTTPKVAPLATPESSSFEVFLATIQNTDPGSNAGIPGLQVPIALGATSKLPVGLELDGPAGSDRRLIAIGLAIEAALGRLPAP
jgi:Asp-tRNA(Asn)/Glu-tRNA(Gln) amidotransferase A subunit family amidase